MVNKSGFHVFCGKRIQPNEQMSLENLARYIIRASFSQERMRYLDREGTVIYAAKDGNDRKIFEAEEWLAAMCSHIPNCGEQMVRYYGWYSNVLRGKRQKNNAADIIPSIIESDRAPAAYRKSWARLIQKIYEAVGPASQQLADDFQKTYGNSPIIDRILAVIAQRAKAV